MHVEDERQCKSLAEQALLVPERGARDVCADHILEGAPLSPCELAAARALLSVCCCAHRRTVLGLSFSSGHDPSGYQHLLFELRTPHSGSLSVRGRGVELGRARAMCIAVAFSQK